jgi:hypothetical protein
VPPTGTWGSDGDNGINKALHLPAVAHSLDERRYKRKPHSLCYFWIAASTRAAELRFLYSRGHIRDHGRRAAGPIRRLARGAKGCFL